MTHKARKRFGQNFLVDPTIIADIIHGLGIVPGEHWVEIGPGRGALTAPLLHQPITLDVVELDRDLVVLLTKKFGAAENLTIHSADALHFNFSALAGKAGGLRIIGNLPYNISTPLLFHLLDRSTCIGDMHFMLQKEVVERLCATPGSKKYGRLSVMTQYYCSVDSLFDVPPECFSPPPKVTSAVVRLTPHRRPPVAVDDFSALNTLVIQAFSQRRKTIRNALKKLLSVQQILEAEIDPTLRPELLSLADFARLSNSLGDNSEKFD